MDARIPLLEQLTNTHDFLTEGVFFLIECPMSMDRKQIDWSRFEELADLMFQVASDQGTEIIWGGHWKTFVDKCHFELRG